MKKIILSFLLILGFSYLFGQSTETINQQFNWAGEPIIHNPFEISDPLEIYTFDGAIFRDQHPSLP
ncbi:MAG: hypothetical protein AAF573_11805, partial [Bacteroidota bacterium]